MAIPQYLAMTGVEFRQADSLPQSMGWMACHFSPYSTGLSNLPPSLPPDSLLILNDRIPMGGRQDFALIVQELSQCLEENQCCGLLLDFQRRDIPQNAALASYLVRNLSACVIVSAMYAKDLSCPVFLPPVPPDRPTELFLKEWQGRKIWLELSLCPEQLVLTQSGVTVPVEEIPFPKIGFSHEALCCHYCIRTERDSVTFTLWRTRDDNEALLQKAEGLGVVGGVGLFQEWQRLQPSQSQKNTDLL